MNNAILNQTTTTAKTLLASIRSNVTPAARVRASGNTKAPIQPQDVATVRAHIKANSPRWLLAFYDLGIETGWRTADCANLRYSSIDWATGVATIVVAKQTKAAQARALAKGLAEVRETRKATALAAGDAVAYMRWSAATRDQLADDATPLEIDRIKSLVSSAAVKVDSKTLSPDLLARLAAMKGEAFWDQGDDGYVFSRALTASNASRGDHDKAITRATFWARLKGVFTELADKVQDAGRLSAYSLRKAFAVALYLASGKSLAVVMATMGHATEAMTMRYMGLDDESRRVQSAMVGGGV